MDNKAPDIEQRIVALEQAVNLLVMKLGEADAATIRREANLPTFRPSTAWTAAEAKAWRQR
jgi:hypothetical protein